MRALRRATFVFAALPALLCAQADASTVDYTVTSLGATQWRYDYSITNSLSAPVDEFTVFFDQTQYGRLQPASTVPVWNALVVQPDNAIPAAGFYDGLATAGGVAASATATGFSVTFNYLGTGTPGSQPFSFVDPTSFNVLESGQTTAAAIPQVPEPSAWLLLASGTLPLLWLRRRAARPVPSLACGG